VIAALRLILATIALCGAPALAQQFASPTADLQALAYHDVRVTVTRDFDGDQFAVSAEHLAQHFSWLRSNGYTAVSLDDLIAARDGKRALPPRAVLITFDDGLRSVYTQVFPLLRIFNYPAVVSVVTSWIETPAPVVYDDRTLDAEDFLTWAQVREMQASGLVEIASHSHALHAGVPANPQGNLQPAAVTRIVADGRYENEDAFVARVGADLARSSTEIRTHTGRSPRAITWPYGAWNEPAREAAERVGLPVSLALNAAHRYDGPGTVIARELIAANPGVGDFAGAFAPPRLRPLMRALQVDLADVFDPDAQRREQRLGALLDRVKTSGASHVLLRAGADTDADGRADALYFPNRELPVRADLFNRAAWQLATRAHVQVFASLPLDAFALPEPAAERIASIYADLAMHAGFQGLLLEEVGEEAAASSRALRQSVVAAVRRHRPEVVTVSEMRANVRATDADALTASLGATLDEHDFTLLTVQPAPLDVAAASRLCNRLMPAIAAQPKGVQRTLIGLPPLGPADDAEAVGKALATLGACGVRNFAWAAGAVPATDAELSRLRHLMSAADMPWRE
jgi:biofilm PGA synthesis lipoprotein PgaB